MKSKYLKVALEAAKKAEEVIMGYYSGEIKFASKKDLSPVTIADKEAERIIIKTIENSFPQHGVLGEELGGNYSKNKYVWIIDPIDGTKSFLRKIPFFATQIALMKDDEVVLGLSNAPALKELLYAEKDEGSYLNGNPVLVSSVDSLSKAYVGYGNIKHFDRDNAINNLLSLSNSTLGQRGSCDFWNYHLLASGKIDIMVEAKAKIWDIAALSLIVEEAGGKVTDLQGNKLTKKITTSLLATNTILHNAALKFFR